MSNGENSSLKLPTWIQAISAAIGTLAAIVVLGVAYYELQFYREQFVDTQRARKIEKMDALWERFNTLEMLSARAQAAKLHPKGSEPVYEIFSFFERLARAEELGILTPDDVDYYFRDYMLFYWYGFDDWVKTQRRNNGEDPDKGQLYRGYQRLVSALLKQPGVHQPTDADIKSFLKFEQNRFADAKALRVEAALSGK